MIFANSKLCNGMFVSLIVSSSALMEKRQAVINKKSHVGDVVLGSVARIGFGHLRLT
jgi:NDP-sugar pyrophosphorylase family protein